METLLENDIMTDRNILQDIDWDNYVKMDSSELRLPDDSSAIRLHHPPPPPAAYGSVASADKRSSLIIAAQVVKMYDGA